MPLLLIFRQFPVCQQHLAISMLMSMSRRARSRVSFKLKEFWCIMDFVGSEVHGTVHPQLNVGTDGWEGEALGHDISTHGAGLV